MSELIVARFGESPAASIRSSTAVAAAALPLGRLACTLMSVLNVTVSTAWREARALDTRACATITRPSLHLEWQSNAAFRAAGELLTSRGCSSTTALYIRVASAAVPVTSLAC